MNRNYYLLVFIFIVVSSVFIVSCNDDDAVKDSSVELGLCPDENHPHPIDLGIGVKFACCNVGAKNPFEDGYYYAWGETEGKKWYGNDNYQFWDKDFYPLMDLPHDISNTTYDVATVKVGKTWRMPTLEELHKLVDCCRYEWLTVHGVHGGKLTGPTSNSIFIPASGWIGEEIKNNYNYKYNYQGVYGYYRSSTLINDNGSDPIVVIGEPLPISPYYYYFNAVEAEGMVLASDSIFIHPEGLTSGFPVRAVYLSSDNE